MRHGRSKKRYRSPRYESVEQRIVFSAQSPADFQIDYSHTIDDQADEVGQVEQHLTSAHSLTGLDVARDTYGFDGQGQTVVVIDSGIAYDHVALGGGLGAGYRVVGGWDFTEENDADPYDDGTAGSHGTHVAGIIGSDHALYPGVAPGVDLVGLRVFNDYGAGYFEWVEDALQWVHTNRDSFDNPITAVNLSLGASWNDDTVPSWGTLEDELAQLEQDGIFIGVAAGNSYLSYGEPGLGYPAVSPSVVPVASVDADGALSFFSQRHQRVIAAPGRSITSTVPDYVGDNDGIADDFASYSGTSMASPYVTGASVLIREAYEFVGQTNITQDQIYQLMLATGDQVWDSDTNAFYTNLNLQSALDAVMPADDFGSTVASAFSAGLGEETLSVSGTIGELDDIDYFRFTADTTGLAEFTLSSSQVSNPDWLNGSNIDGFEVSGTSLRFSVVAGQEYVVGVGANGEVAHYDLDFNVVPAMIDWGTVFSATFSGERLSNGESWYQLRASTEGLLTVEAMYSGEQVQLELYDSSMQRIGTGEGATGQQRVEALAGSGKMFYVRAVGANSDVDFRVSNFVHVDGSHVTVLGTSGDDEFRYEAGNDHQLWVNGVHYIFDGNQIDSIELRGGGGDDIAYVVGSSANDSVQLRAGSGTWTSNGNTVELEDIDTIRVFSGGGSDTAEFLDSAGKDRFYGKATEAIMLGNGYRNSAEGFDEVTATATDGDDTAYFYDSVGNDRFAADPDSATMSGNGFANAAHNFDRVYAFANAGGNDRADLHDSAGSDAYYAAPNYAWMRGSGYLNLARGFDSVYAYATAGGNDTARVIDSAGDDHFIGRQAYSEMVGFGYYHYLAGFDKVYAYSKFGGDDRATFYDSSGNDKFVSKETYSVMQGHDFSNAAYGFSEIYAYASNVGDSAYLYGISQNHVTVGRDAYLLTTGDGLLRRMDGFGYVTARAASGETADSDVDGVDYVFKRIGSWS